VLRAERLRARPVAGVAKHEARSIDSCWTKPRLRLRPMGIQSKPIFSRRLSVHRSPPDAAPPDADHSIRTPVQFASSREIRIRRLPVDWMSTTTVLGRSLPCHGDSTPSAPARSGPQQTQPRLTNPLTIHRASRFSSTPILQCFYSACHKYVQPTDGKLFGAQTVRLRKLGGVYPHLFFPSLTLVYCVIHSLPIKTMGCGRRSQRGDETV